MAGPILALAAPLIGKGIKGIVSLFGKSSSAGTQSGFVGSAASFVGNLFKKRGDKIPVVKKFPLVPVTTVKFGGFPLFSAAQVDAFVPGTGETIKSLKKQPIAVRERVLKNLLTKTPTPRIIEVISDLARDLPDRRPNSQTAINNNPIDMEITPSEAIKEGASFLGIGKKKREEAEEAKKPLNMFIAFLKEFGPWIIGGWIGFMILKKMKIL